VVDNKLLNASILQLIENKNIDITLAENYNEAFKLVQYEDYDCIIQNNINAEFFIRLRTLKQLIKVPIIIYNDNKNYDIYTENINDLIISIVSSEDELAKQIDLFTHNKSINLAENDDIDLLAIKNNLGNKKILIVDDDTRNTFSLATLLEENGMEIIVANNGVEALDLLDTIENIDLVLMDIMMPEMDGYEAMTKIRVQANFKRLPIIALTAKAMKSDRVRCIESGASDYLSKPIDEKKLFTLLQVWLYK
jgi:CheY-like chemotaxis protein